LRELWNYHSLGAVGQEYINYNGGIQLAVMNGLNPHSLALKLLFLHL
jgi:hypothetical protein